MNDRVAAIVASGDLRMLEMGFMCARNAIEYRWIADVKVYPFALLETRIATDSTLHDTVSMKIGQVAVLVACETCSEKYLESDALHKPGCEVEYTMEPISDAIKAGYSPWCGEVMS